MKLPNNFFFVSFFFFFKLSQKAVLFLFFNLDSCEALQQHKFLRGCLCQLNYTLWSQEASSEPLSPAKQISTYFHQLRNFSVITNLLRTSWPMSAAVRSSGMQALLPTDAHSRQISAPSSPCPPCLQQHTPRGKSIPANPTNAN